MKPCGPSVRWLYETIYELQSQLWYAPRKAKADYKDKVKAEEETGALDI